MRGIFALLLLSMTTSVRPFKILTLHGKGSSSQDFFSRMAPVVEHLKEDGIEFHFLNAPHPMEENGLFQWWTLAPGERSFTAESYGGADIAMRNMRESFEEVGPFDCIWGHSQGAILTSFVLAKQLASDAVPFPLPKMPKLAILNGAAWPAPYGDHVTALVDMEDALEASGLNVLHVVGARDTINPPEQALEIARCYGSSDDDLEAAKAIIQSEDAADAPALIGAGRSKIMVHPGGHVVPMDTWAMEQYRAFFGEEP